MIRLRLRAIRWLLWRADALICDLPTPAEPRGPYFDLWATLGDVHGAIHHLPPDFERLA
jgi:hypothetical protein